MITSECPTIRESDPGPIGLGGEAQLDNRAFLRVVAIAVEEAGVACHWETFVEEDTVPDAGRLTLWLKG
jgi:hypothetical protein